MEETARAFHPGLIRELTNASAECDRLGRSGANTYRCDLYMAPSHHENDVSRGLCLQSIWGGKVEYAEFGFANLEEGYYIVTEANALWFVALFSCRL